MDSPYEHPYPSDEVVASHPFSPLDYIQQSEQEMRRLAGENLQMMRKRRSVRMMSPRDVPADLIASAVAAAGTAPSGANLQPWHFVAVSDPEVKRKIREAAEAEEQTNYLNGRMNEEWQQALAHLGTDWHKEFIEIAPWIVVLFEQRYRHDSNGELLHNYYVKESCGDCSPACSCRRSTAWGWSHSHTRRHRWRSCRRSSDAPTNERPSILFPVGYPTEGALVPDLSKKNLDEILTIDRPLSDSGPAAS